MKVQQIATPLESTARPCMSTGTPAPVFAPSTGDVRLRTDYVPFAVIKGIHLGTSAWSPPV